MSVAGVLSGVVLSLGMLLGSSQGSSSMESVPEPEKPVSCTASESNSGPVGTWGCDPHTRSRLTLGEDGRFGGHDGCNAFRGQWRMEGEVIVFSEWIATQMYCWPEPDFSPAWTGRVDGDTMHLYDRDGVETDVLPRVTVDR